MSSHVAPSGAADPPSGNPLISHAQLLRLYDVMLEQRLLDSALRREFLRKKWSTKHLPALEHPAVSAGIFSNARAGDSVAAPNYSFAANLASGALLPTLLRDLSDTASAAKSPRRRITLDPAAQLAAITGAALAQQAAAQGQIVLALPAREFWLEDKASATILRWAAERHLPILYITLARSLPEPGESQSKFGLPQISVDANDVVAVYRVAQECVQRARAGIGPTWIQCCLPAKSRPTGPLAVMQKFLEARKLVPPSHQKDTEKKWREQWKRSWKTASRSSSEAAGALPISSFHAGL